MKKILYLAHIRLPTEKAHGAQIMKTCEALSEEGSQVELVVPGRKTHIAEDPFSYYGVKKNFTITTRKSPDLVSFGFLGFVFSALWFSEVAKWQKKFWSADVIYSRDAILLLQYILLGRRLVYEAHTKPTFISMLVARFSWKVIVISEGLRDVYVAKGINKNKIIVAHDAIDEKDFQKEYSKEDSRQWLGIPSNKQVALYVGRIDSNKGADTFAAASETLPEKILCVLVGSGPLKKDLQEKHPKALFLPETPYRELPRVLAAGDALVLPNSAQDENAARFTSPLKAFAYLAVGKLIVASNVPALRSILEEKAVFFEADSETDLGQKISENITKHYEKEPRYYTWQERARTILQALHV